MNTGDNTNSVIVHIYNEINEGKYKTTKHYQITDVQDKTKHLLTTNINITLNRGFAKSKPNYWLKIREGKKWGILTGLFYIREHGFYKGDIGKNNVKTNLIILKTQDDFKSVVIYVFNFYTNDLDSILHFIK